MNNSWFVMARYGIVALIWTGVLVLAISLSGNIALMSDGGDGLVGLGIAAFICAAIATGFLMQDLGQPKPEATEATASGKAKNDQRGIDPLSLLSDDDLAELRADIKDSLRRRVLEGQDGELGTLDALLAENDRRRR